MIGGVAAAGDTDGDLFAEAADLVEALARALPALVDDARPERVQEAFRAVHSLKGLAGLCGAAALVEVASGMEGVLDGMRLGRVAGTAEVVDALAEGIEWSVEALGAARLRKVVEVPGLVLERLVAIGKKTRTLPTRKARSPGRCGKIPLPTSSMRAPRKASPSPSPRTSLPSAIKSMTILVTVASAKASGSSEPFEEGELDVCLVTSRDSDEDSRSEKKKE